jgi:polyphosphate glucokinase
MRIDRPAVCCASDNPDLMAMDAMARPLAKTRTRGSRRRRTLMIDVGGGSVKLRVSGHRGSRVFESGDDLSAAEMVRHVRALTKDWSYDRVSLGYPGRVFEGHPVAEPPRVGTGWVHFDYAEAMNCPVRILNDACMQALAAYRGGTLLYIGLGTGLGSALIAENVLIPLELGLLRVEPGQSLLDLLAAEGLARLGLARWRARLFESVHDLAGAFSADDVILGGGNAARVSRLPDRWRRQPNTHCLRGAERLWGDSQGVLATPVGATWHIHPAVRRR